MTQRTMADELAESAVATDGLHDDIVTLAEGYLAQRERANKAESELAKVTKQEDALARAMQQYPDPNTDWWIIQLTAWKECGVFDRIAEHCDLKTEVLVPRSDGTTSPGTILRPGYGGLTVTLAITGTDLSKIVDTEVFLRLNPSFGPCFPKPAESCTEVEWICALAQAMEADVARDDVPGDFQVRVDVVLDGSVVERIATTVLSSSVERPTKSQIADVLMAAAHKL